MICFLFGIVISNHPFYNVLSKEWTDAGKLNLDTILLNIYENNSSIVKLRSYSQYTTVYNLTVANDHTYFVGSGGVLGHNMNNGCPNPKSIKIFGHTFNKHGQKIKINQLKDRARNNQQIGQFLDDKIAAPYVFSLAQKGPGVHEMLLPIQVEARVALPNGNIIDANLLRVIVKSDGSIKTAYPLNFLYSKGRGK